jgi:hypothetical protein
MIRRYHAVQNFFPEGEAFRKLLTEHFANPYEQTNETHGVWNYWHVPEMYTYLKASPQRIFPAELLERFRNHLSNWALENLGVCGLTEPQLHLYVHGCGQELHSDYHNGYWGYVFSLTDWEERRFIGGETLLLRDGELNHKRHHVHGSDLYEAVPARLNQLLVFDDSIVHGVRRVEGTMSPIEGRAVLTGHITASEPIVEGPLCASKLKDWWKLQVVDLGRAVRRFPDVHGLLTCRLLTHADGTVEKVSILAHQLVSTARDEEAVSGAQETILTFLTQSRLPGSTGPSTVTIGVLVPVPNRRAIEIDLPHGLAADEVKQRLDRRFGSIGAKRTWDGLHCSLVMESPVCEGTVVLDSGILRLSIEIPEMRPSHREALEGRVRRLLEEVLQ